jgi:hypothetical protein
VADGWRREWETATFCTSEAQKGKAMNKIPHIKSFFVLILSLFSTGCMAQKGRTTLEIKEGIVGMIGYGTLMSLQSMEQTLGHKYTDSVYPVHLVEYVRGWTYLRPINDPRATSTENFKYYGFLLQNNDSIPFEGMTNLNIESKKQSKMNCILYLIPEKDLVALDKREIGYQKVDVTDKIEEYDIKGGKVYVYQHFPDSQHESSSDGKGYILVKEYVDFITQACDSIGRNFRTEFDKSTNPPTTQIVPYKQIIWKKVTQ